MNSGRRCARFTRTLVGSVCELIRDGILKHFNPWKLSDLQYVLELRCFKGLVSDEDLKYGRRVI